MGGRPEIWLDLANGVFDTELVINSGSTAKTDWLLIASELSPSVHQPKGKRWPKPCAELEMASRRSVANNDRKTEIVYWLRCLVLANRYDWQLFPEVTENGW